jgi:ATP-dependent exoDNAse (exonuclease V) beta subunit
MTDLAALDRSSRLAAIDPAESFVVQAPAGSGKTSLLTHRFLRLLACVEQPEEIVAITFTRKAAAEMRHRVVSALEGAQKELAADAGEHERAAHELARAALDNSRRHGWELERHSSRLHIQTIDGLNHWLAARLPLTARLGLSPQLLDDARPLYREAARRFGTRLENDDGLAADIARLVRLLDSNPSALEVLVADMLGRRETWLPKLLELSAVPDMRGAMEGLLAAACRANLERLHARLDQALMREIVCLLASRAAADPGGPLAGLHGLAGLPRPEVHARGQWECLAGALLTGKDEVRKTVNRNQGFPPEDKAAKQRFVDLLGRLGGESALVDALVQLRELPPDRYSDEQWSRVAALCRALIPAAAELQALFGERALADHAAVAAAAREALGGEQAPTELAQALDYRIRHILVDEYQDTSPAQQRLLERLVAGWQPGDGHSLFCVGDPMQSIYGFREADVTLFFDAQSHGIGGVRLARRSLTRNFRSCRAIVDWVNRSFGALLPAAADYESGAVPYTPSAATRADEAAAGVTVHALAGDDDAQAARTVVDAIEQSLSEIDQLGAAGPEAAPAERTVAVLVRSRTVLPPILSELRRRGIEYRGVELEGLSQRPAVRDLLALTRALLHIGDRSAWLSVLRAPWCGLALADLHALAAPDRKATVVSRLEDAGTLATLTADGRRRVARVLPVLQAAMNDRGRLALGSWVRSCWLALAGPATLEEASDLENVESCFLALDALGAEAGPTPAASEVEAALEGLMASPVGNVGARVQLMTIHKAKGLEFDTVILPGLERTVSSGPRQLLYWTQVAVEGAGRGIVLASRGGDDEGRAGDALEAWMKLLERDRTRHEVGRLAYVAATRARRRLHLVGSVGISWKDEEAPSLVEPRDGSLLAFFWPAVSAHFEDAFRRTAASGGFATASGDERPRRAAPPLRRLPDGYVAPPVPAGVLPARRRIRSGPDSVRPQFEWAGEEAVAVGTIVHAELERLGRRRLPAASLTRRPDEWANALLRLGLPAARHAAAIARISLAVDNLARSETAAALLDPEAREAASELALTAWLDGEFVSVKIDRTFVDRDGLRWVVDWKTGSHEGADIDTFLQQEVERYSPQLERYARVMQLHDPRPLRTGLYFPLLDAWKAWRG